jgi:hypothetical protein
MRATSEKYDKVLLNGLKDLVLLLSILLFFYFFSIKSACYYLMYYRAQHYGITVSGSIDSKVCHEEKSIEYPDETYCDIKYSFKYNDNTYTNRIDFIREERCSHILPGACLVVFMASNPDRSYLVGFHKYSLFWTILKFLITIIAFPISILFFFAYVSEQREVNNSPDNSKVSSET